MAFKNGIRHKRNALRTRMARLETRQAAERSELFMAQSRLSETIARISAIELNNIKDTALANKKRKENDAALQRANMKQQKESEFLREMQLCKSRQMQRTSELEIALTEEMEELLSTQKHEEFELTAKQALIEGEAATAIENQRAEIETAQLFEKQKMQRDAMQRAQKRQGAALMKQQKAAARTREKIVLAENPIIKGDVSSGEKSLIDDASSNGGDSIAQSSRSSVVLQSQNGDVEEDGEDVSKEAVENSKSNRYDQSQMTDSQKELQVLAEQGRDRLRTIIKHHHAALNELRTQHRNQVNLKQKDHRRKTADLHKEQEDEMELLKQEQIQTMEDLVNSQLIADDDLEEQQNNLVLSSLPFHIIADLDAGRTPQPVKFKNISVFCAEIANVNYLAQKLSPANFISALKQVESRVNKCIKSHNNLMTIETSDAHVWLVSSGIVNDLSCIDGPVAEQFGDESGESSSDDGTGGVRIGGAKATDDNAGEAEQSSELEAVKAESSPSKLAAQIVACLVELVHVDFSDIKELEGEAIDLKIGVHTGAAVGGLVGKKVPMYSLVGDAVDVSSKLCSSGAAGAIHVSPYTKSLLEGEYNVEQKGDAIMMNGTPIANLWIKLGSDESQ